MTVANFRTREMNFITSVDPFQNLARADNPNNPQKKINAGHITRVRVKVYC